MWLRSYGLNRSMSGGKIMFTNRARCGPRLTRLYLGINKHFLTASGRILPGGLIRSRWPDQQRSLGIACL
jgi:hypothetical protein